MIKRLIRRVISKSFLAAAVTEAKGHVIFGALIRWLLDWNMRAWQRGTLYNLKQFAKFRNGEDNERPD